MRQPLGQHFLRDGHAVKTIVAAADLHATETALEIGPGKGIMTEAIAKRVKRLVAVELDASLAQHLRSRLAGLPKITIVHQDILKTDLDALFPSAERPIKILGNLPYSITSPIFEKLMPWPGWDRGIFLIQREVAERIASRPGSRAYGILSLAVQLFADVESILDVKPGAFHPPPRVLSRVIRLHRKKTPLLKPEETDSFFDLAHAAFAHRRKTIANSLALFSGIRRADIESWLARHKISATVRAETITLEEYVQLAMAWSIFRREMKLTTDSATSTIPRT